MNININATNSYLFSSSKVAETTAVSTSRSAQPVSLQKSVSPSQSTLLATEPLIYTAEGRLLSTSASVHFGLKEPSARNNFV